MRSPKVLLIADLSFQRERVFGDLQIVARRASGQVPLPSAREPISLNICLAPRLPASSAARRQREVRFVGHAPGENERNSKSGPQHRFLIHLAKAIIVIRPETFIASRHSFVAFRQ
jgi:hypothetical protein